METIRSIRCLQLQASVRSTWTFVEVETSEGQVGTGEASVPCQQHEVAARVQGLRAHLLGTDARVSSEAFGAPGSAASLPEVAAVCAVDEALHDLDAQRSGRPIAAMIGTALRSSVAAYANVNRRTTDRSPAGFAASAAAAVCAGMDAVKVAPFDRVRPHLSREEARPLLATAFERIAAVREAIGPGRKLLVDCHWRLSPPMVDEVVRIAAENHVYWLETPLAEEPACHADIRRARALANEAGVRLAGGELHIGLAGFAPLIDGDLYDVVMPDMTFVGGYQAFLRVAEAAAARGIAVSPHNPTGPICHAHSVQVSAIAAGFLHLETQFDETPLFGAIVDGQLPGARGGAIEVPCRSGLGLRLRHEAITATPRVDAAHT